MCSIIEITAAFGAYAAHYYTKTRMGMLRHVVYLNGKWERLINIPILKWVTLLMLIILIFIVYFLNKKQKPHSIAVKITAIITIIINLSTVFYLLFFNVGMNRAYYILSICFLIIAVFQNIIYYCFYSIEIQN